MTTHTISYFKNHALGLLDAVAAKGESLLITRRGKPLAQVEPVKSQQGIVFGKLRGTMEIKGDIVAPLGDEDWQAAQ
jgi:prevent-host-death family protein